MKILAIETSCDETALAVIEARGGLSNPQFEILGSVISSQIAIHRPFGGVVPNLAKREHAKNLPLILKQIFKNLKLNNSKIDLKLKIKNLKLDALAVTIGPGLEPALWTGIEFAKNLYKKLITHNKQLKIIGANHLEGHLYSFLLAQKTEFPISNFQIPDKSRKNKKSNPPISGQNIKKLFPAIALIVSGGHTILLKMDSLTKWKKLGETRDDAVGEAFDKVAKMLGLPYPGGPEIQKAAEKGNPHAIEFPRPMIYDKNYDFSYSGLKTSVLYYLRDLQQTTYNKQQINDVAASFQEAALEVLVKKAERAVKEFGAKSILLSGGVAANASLREKLKVTSKKLKVKFMAPPMKFNTDNAVMIGIAAYISILQKKYPSVSKARGNMSV